MEHTSEFTVVRKGPRPSVYAAAGVCAYLLSLLLPARLDISLPVLAVFSLVAMTAGAKSGLSFRHPLLAPILVFLLATGLSTLLSRDPRHCLELSFLLVPATLLFLLVAGYIDRPVEFYLVYLVFSLVGVVQSSLVLWTAYHVHWHTSRELMFSTASPLLLVANDSTFLAVIMPLSVVVLVLGRRSKVLTVFAIVTIALGMAAIVVLRSRTALVTALIALATTVCVLARSLRPSFRIGLLVGPPVLAVAADAILGFPLLSKLINGWEASRLELWSRAWDLFLESPVFGSGPHTFNLVHRIPWVHNLYLEILTEQGAVGLAAFGLILGSATYWGWKVYPRVDGTRQVLCLGAIVALAALLIASLVELTLTREWVAITFYALLAVIGNLARSVQKGGRQ